MGYEPYYRNVSDSNGIERVLWTTEGLSVGPAGAEAWRTDKDGAIRNGLFTGTAKFYNTAEPVASFGSSSSTSLVEMRRSKTLVASGNEVGRGAIRLIDTISTRTMEIGYYQFGAGIFTNNLFEVWSQGFSLRSLDASGTILYIRNPTDTGGFKIWDDGSNAATISYLLDAGGGTLPIRVVTNAVLAATFGAGRTVLGSVANSDDTVHALQVQGAIAFQDAATGVGKTVMDGTVDGRLLLTNAAGTSFGLAQLGGTTSSFPAIKQNGNSLNFRLADDSGFCDIALEHATLTGVLVIGSSPAASGDIRLKGSGVINANGNLTLQGTLAGGLTLNTLVAPASSGTRYLIIDTAGKVTSSASAPSGT